MAQRKRQGTSIGCGLGDGQLASQGLRRGPSRPPACRQRNLAPATRRGRLRSLLAHQEREKLVARWVSSRIEFWPTTGRAPRFVIEVPIDRWRVPDAQRAILRHSEQGDQREDVHAPPYFSRLLGLSQPKAPTRKITP